MGLRSVGQSAADQTLGSGANELARPGVVLPHQPVGQVLGGDGALDRRDHTLGQGRDVAGEAVDEVVDFVSGYVPADPALALRCLGVVQIGAQHRLQGVSVPWKERGARLDECLDVLEAVWTTEPVARTASAPS